MSSAVAAAAPVRPPRSAFVAAFGAVYLVWGSTYLAIRIAVGSIPPFLLGGTRFVCAGLILGAFLALRGGFRLRPRQWRDNAAAGVLMLAGGNGLVCWSEQSLPSGVTTLILSLIPLFFALGEWTLPGGGRPAKATFAGIALGLGGLFLLVGPGGAAASDPRHCAGVLAACLAWTAGSLYSRRSRDPADPLASAAAQMICGGGAMLLIALAAGESFRPGTAAGSAAAAWLYLVLVGSLVGYSCYVWLLKHSTPARASTHAFVNPVVAVFLGWAVLDEPMTARTLSACAVIVAGVALITAGKAKAAR